MPLQSTANSNAIDRQSVVVSVEVKEVQTDKAEPDGGVAVDDKTVQTDEAVLVAAVSSPGESPPLPLSPPVQDNLVARVLLEHVHPDYQPPRDPHRSVNYLDLSRLGEEGETPASDEIWLAVEDDNDCGAGFYSDLEDKFLSTDEEEVSFAIDLLLIHI